MPTKKIINGKIVAVMSVGELAKHCGYSTISIKKMEERKILPMPNLRGKNFSNGELGNRLYTVELADKLKVLLAEIKNGIKTPDTIKQKIAIAFQEEKIKLTT